MSIKVTPVRRSVRPNVYITTNTDALIGSSNDTPKRLMLIGMANGGEPGQIYEINTLEQAKQVFRGGDLLEAIEVAMTPDDTHSSGTIMAERVGTATQASFKNKGLTLTSKAFSVDANNIQTSLTKNTLNDTYTLFVNFDIDGYYQTYTNLGKIISLSYSGTQNYADVSIITDVAPKGDTSGDKHTGFATKLVLKAGADKSSATVVHEFPLAMGKYKKVSELVTDISEIDGFTAYYFNGRNKNIETKYLDAVDSLEISKDANNPTSLTSLGGDIVNSLTNGADLAITADYSPIDGEPEQYGLTTLSGGSSSQIAPASWATYLKNFSTVDGYYLVPLTDDISIQEEALSFCAERNKEADPRALIVGGGFNDPINVTTQRSTMLRSKEARVLVNSISGSKLMQDGAVEDLPAYIIAAQFGGLASGLNIGESLTYKHLNLVDIDQKYTKDELDLLDLNGAVGIEFVRERNNQYFRITNDSTTAKPISDDPGETELATAEAIDFLVTALRAELEDTFIGTSTTLSTASDIKASIIGFLQQEQNDGVIEDYKESGIHVYVDGETARIDIESVLTRTLKTIEVTLSFVDEQLSA